MKAHQIGTTGIRLVYAGVGQSETSSTSGVNGNRIGIYTLNAGSGSMSWNVSWQQMSGGTSPTKWRVVLPFGSLLDAGGSPVPTHAVRRMRWTYAAAMQPAAFQRSEFEVVVSNWSVSGTNR